MLGSMYRHSAPIEGFSAVVCWDGWPGISSSSEGIFSGAPGQWVTPGPDDAGDPGSNRLPALMSGDAVTNLVSSRTSEPEAAGTSTIAESNSVYQFFLGRDDGINTWQQQLDMAHHPAAV